MKRPVAAMMLVLCAACTSGPRGATDAGPTVRPSPSGSIALFILASTEGWRTFEDKGYQVSFRYPTDWRSVTSEHDRASFSDGIVWVGTAQMHDPCAVERDEKVMSVSCENAFDELEPGEVVMNLRFAGGPRLSGGAEAFDKHPGAPTRISGKRAKIHVQDEGSDDAPRVVVAYMDRGSHEFQMEAWFRGPRFKDTERIVRTVFSTIEFEPVN